MPAERRNAFPLGELPADLLLAIARLDPMPDVSQMVLRSVDRACLSKLPPVPRRPAWAIPPLVHVTLTVGRRGENAEHVRLNIPYLRWGQRTPRCATRLTLDARLAQLEWLLRQGVSVSADDLYSTYNLDSRLAQLDEVSASRAFALLYAAKPAYDPTCPEFRKRLVRTVATRGRLPLLRLLVEEQGFPDGDVLVDALPSAIYDGNVPMLDWFYRRHCEGEGRLPPVVRMRGAGGGGMYADLDKTAPERIAEVAIELGHLEMLQWTCRHGYAPGEEARRLAFDTMQKWLSREKTRGHMKDESSLRQEIIRGLRAILAWLRSERRAPRARHYR